MALVAVAIYLVLVLSTYDKADPGWSHSIAGSQVHNAGGRFGAWVADMLLYLFGLSAYWWVLFCLFATLWGYRRLEVAGGSDRRPFWIASIGFGALVLSSASLEALRLHRLAAALPLAPGGMLGLAIGEPLQRFFGFTGSTLVLLFAGAIGASLFTGLSWLAVVERLGEWVERA